MADDGLLAVGGVGLLAVIALGVALLRDGGRRVINIPSDVGGGSSSGGSTVPDDLQEPEDDNWQYQEPNDDPANDDFDYDFGGSSSDGSDDGGGTGSIPDSLADFDPSGRADLISDDNPVGL